MILVSKKLVFGILGAVLAIAILVGLVFAMRAWEYSEGTVSVSYSDETPGYDPENERPSIYHGDSWYVRRENVETLLLMGVDKFESQIYQQDSYRNDQQADFFLLLVVDHANQTCTPIQINRDTMVQFNVLGVGGANAGSFFGQLALSHTYGSGANDSCRNTVDAVSSFLQGTQIDHYVSFTMDAVAVINDALGGVTVTVQDDFSGIDSTLKKGEQITLRADQALTYVRSRKDMADSSNLARQQRQLQYMTAFYQRFREVKEQDQSVSAKAVLQAAPYMVSDCTMEQLGQLAEVVGEYLVADTLTIAGESKMGAEYVEFHADEEAVTALILDVLYEKEM